MPRILSVRLDEQLDAQIEAFASMHDLSRSAAARELLRQSLTDADDITRGWLEGKQQAMATVYDAVSEALGKLTREA